MVNKFWEPGLALCDLKHCFVSKRDNSALCVRMNASSSQPPTKGPQVIITERTDCLLRKETPGKENFIKRSLRIKLCQPFNKNKPLGVGGVCAEEEKMDSIVLTLKLCLHLKLTSWKAY